LRGHVSGGIVDAIALLGRDFTPSPAELARAGKTKADRFWQFDDIPAAALFNGAFNAPMLWNSNFFMTLESMGSGANWVKAA
jgi:putative pyruvate formate lyase activating enzyme